ncbi:hypothetical protein D3C83_99250 [compost metagenome]
MPVRLRHLGGYDVALNRAQSLFVLFRALCSLLCALRIVLSLPVVGAGIAPIREAGCENGVQFALGHLWKPAPLLDHLLFVGFVGNSRNWQ